MSMFQPSHLLQPLRRRFTAVTIAIGCTLAALPCTPIYAEEGSCGDNTKWSVNGTTLTLSGSGAVEYICWALRNEEITTVIIEDGVTSLPSNSFSNFKVLESLTMADSVISIGSSFCQSCVALTDLTLSDQLTVIPSGAFTGCKLLPAVELPDSITTIENNAFYGCVKLKALSMPDALVSVGSHAFFGNSVEELNLNQGLQSIGDNAFNYSCFESVIVPDSITAIGSSAFGQVYSKMTNKDGEITGTYYGDPVMVTLKGSAGGYAQQYANVNGLNFEVYDSSGEHTCSGNWIVDTAATCETDGSRHYVCSTFGQTYYETIAATGHSWSEWTVTQTATCTADGVQTRTCANCGEQETNAIPATGHNWSEWTVTQVATCTADGMQTRTCANCGTQETNPISAVGHNWSNWVTIQDPTVNTEGQQQRTCYTCGAVEYQSIPVLGSHAIRVNVSEGGTANPLGETLVEVNGNLTVTFSPYDGYQIADVLIDNVSVGAVPSYTFYNVIASHSVSVTFMPIQVIPNESCSSITVALKDPAAYWQPTDAAFSMDAFTIIATMLADGQSTQIDITNDCVPNMTPAQLYQQNGINTYPINFRYTGNNTTIQDYFNANAVTASVQIACKGDADLNGSVTADDATIALAAYINTMLDVDHGLSDLQIHLIDITKDGIIEADDATMILKYYVMTLTSGSADWDNLP